MARSVAYVFLGVLFASLLISTIAANDDHDEKNAIEANQATSEKQLRDFGGGGGEGGGFGGPRSVWPDQGGDFPGGGWRGGRGRYRCNWGRCCDRDDYYYDRRYCNYRCCYSAQEALANMQNGLWN